MSFFDKISVVMGKICLPLAREGMRTMVVSTFEEFLVQKEEEIKVVLGVEDSRTIIRDLRSLFRDFVDRVPTRVVMEEEEGEEEDEIMRVRPRQSQEADPFYDPLRQGRPRDPWE